MKRDTHKTSQDHAPQAERARKPLRLDRETLRMLSGGSRGPVLLEPSWRESQCPTKCYE
jgi:hypothetical protein